MQPIYIHVCFYIYIYIHIYMYVYVYVYTFLYICFISLKNPNTTDIHHNATRTKFFPTLLCSTNSCSSNLCLTQTNIFHSTSSDAESRVATQ